MTWFKIEDKEFLKKYPHMKGPFLVRDKREILNCLEQYNMGSVEIIESSLKEAEDIYGYNTVHWDELYYKDYVKKHNLDLFMDIK